MAIALFITITLGLIVILLSLEIDKLRKLSSYEKKIQEDRIYKFSALFKLQEKIAYATNAEKAADIIISSLESFFDYSVASYILLKNDSLIIKTYVEEEIGNEYIKSVEKSMLSSLSSLIGTMPEKIDRKIYGTALNDSVKMTYSSSFHVPLIVENKVAALIHLSSTKENLYKDKDDIETLYRIIEIAASSLTRFSQALDKEQDISISLVGSIADGVFLTDNQNSLLYINDSAKRALRLSKKDVNFFDIANAFSKNLHLGLIINDVIVNNKPFTAKEIPVDGEGVLDIFITPVKNNRASIVLRDMTEYKKREVLKEDIMYAMVHELRAPLTTIKDASELIISTKDFEENKKIKFLEIIHQQAKKLLGRIVSILDTAKLDAGKLTLQKTKGDIAKLIKSEMQTFIPQAERKNISLNFDILCPSLPLVSFDSIRISQVIDNLLSNSIKFTDKGGKIKVEADCRVIPPTLDGSSPMEDFLSLDKFIVVSVSDTGVGISKEQQKLLFSKYTQAQNVPRQLAKLGTGLGLYMVKGIIESHGGRVWVKSAPGQGTTISFTLPYVNAIPKTYTDPKPTSFTRQTLN